jgi:phosphoenolpyruvate---glycerone phosphotransferase subunit DhaL
MLGFVGHRVISQEAYLNSLDAALGDGDHGITMRLGFEAISETMSKLDSTADLGLVLRTAGMAFMGATGGAIGVIFGKMLMAGARPLNGLQRFSIQEFKALVREMEMGITSTSNVQVGDKTILDAVHAANLNVSSVDGSDTDLAFAASVAAQAAENGARDTSDMICKVGRASRLGERSLGYLDPGAVSFAIVLRAMADWFREMDSAI